MITNDEALIEYFKTLRTGDYQRDNFNLFLKEIKFSFPLHAVHLSGTNGKGTTGTVLKNIYQEAGYKVAHFSSPYLFSPREMITYDGQSIAIEKIASLIAQYEHLFKKYNLSEFEVEAFLAFTYFLEVKPDLTIIECGMGGLIDATNIFTPILSIITSISLEHTSFLGSSLTEIAFHKAGIIKKRVPLLIGPIEESALEVIKEVASQEKAPIHQVGPYLDERLLEDGYLFSYKPYQDLKIPSLALFSVLDASFALGAVEILKPLLNVSREAIYLGVAKTSLPGRMEVLNHSPLLIVDGAHNPEATSRLKESLEKLQGDKKIHIIFAAFNDKNITMMLAELNFISNDITLTTFPHPRARKEEEYFLYLDEFLFVEDYRTLIKEKIAQYPEDIIVITGSLAFAGLVSQQYKKGLIK